MDITKDNFIDLLPEITSTIEKCDFIGFDTELSGLMRERSVNRFDLPEERFVKAIESSRDYVILQFGLSCFTQKDAHHYSNRTYNFYIFPQANEGYGDVNRTFSIQAHSIHFLTEHGFDFNKLFKHGLSYINFQEKKAITNKLKNEFKSEKEIGTGDKIEEKLKTTLTIAKGFLEVLELVIYNKKPIVGHNCTLDLIQIFNQFIQPLSDDYSSFKDLCHSLFPLVYDTKFIAHSMLDPETLTNNQSRLSDLYSQLRSCDDFVKIKVDQPESSEGQLPHQAGYDAYMSGYCFIALCETFVKCKKKHKVKKEDPDNRPASIAQDHQVVNEFANKIHLSYSYDFKCFNLGGDDEEPNRDHLFYLEHPPTWELNDLFKVFQTCGGITACRLSKATALCALRNPKKVAAALQLIQNLKNHNPVYKIHTYDDYLMKFKHRA